MTREATPIDIGSTPDFPRLIREVAREGRHVVLRDGDTDLAILSPAKPPRRKRRTLTPAQREAFLSSAGGWKGLVDVEEFKRDIKEARSDHRTPPRL